MKPGEPRFTPVPDSIMRRRDLTFGAKCLLCRLKRYAHKTGKCFPSLPTLATELGTSVDSVKRFRAQLMEAGLISVAKVGRGSGNRTDYIFNDTQKKGAETPPLEKAAKGGRNTPFSGSAKGGKSAPEKGAKVHFQKGAETPPKETSRRSEETNKQTKTPAVKVNGFFPHESDRRKINGTYQATLADGQSLQQLMFDTTGKTEKVETALRWLRPARRADGWWDIEKQLREKLARNRPRNNAWFKTVLENEFGLSPDDAKSQKSEFVEKYKAAITLADPAERSLAAQRCVEEAQKAGIPLMGVITGPGGPYGRTRSIYPCADRARSF